MNRNKLFIIAIIGFVLIVLCCMMFKSASIENDLKARTIEVLENKNIQVDSLQINGRDISLFGSIRSDSLKNVAEKVTGNIFGVRQVYNELKVVIPEPTKSEKIEKSYDKLDVFLQNNLIYFNTDLSSLTPNDYDVLDKLTLLLLEEYPEVVIEIAGNTDSEGNESYNFILSKRRAEVVYYYLVKKEISETRLKVVGYGESNPIASNQTIEGRIKNRRIEFQRYKEK